MNTIVFINEKGGIGKTSACFNIAWELSNKCKILLLDLDGQRANLTYFCGVDKNENTLTLCDTVQRGADIKDVIIEVKENLDIVPANVEVSSLNQTIARVTRFKKILRDIEENYDYCFIDVSPSPNWGQYLALSSADFAIIPMLPDIASLEADRGIVETIQEVQDTSNQNLKVLGILLNRDENRTNMAKSVKNIAEQFAGQLESTIFNASIRNSVIMGETILSHVGVTEYDPKAKVSEDIKNLCDEIEERVRKWQEVK